MLIAQGQRVLLGCCESCVREVDEATGKEDPFGHHGCGLWWLSWVLFGADPSTVLSTHEELSASAAGQERFGRLG